jgi:hypothetical protein
MATRGLEDEAARLHDAGIGIYEPSKVIHDGRAPVTGLAVAYGCEMPAAATDFAGLATDEHML